MCKNLLRTLFTQYLTTSYVLKLTRPLANIPFLHRRTLRRHSGLCFLGRYLQIDKVISCNEDVYTDKKCKSLKNIIFKYILVIKIVNGSYIRQVYISEFVLSLIDYLFR